MSNNNPLIPTNNVAPPSGEAPTDSTRETLQSAHNELMTIVEQLETARTAIVQRVNSVRSSCNTCKP